MGLHHAWQVPRLDANRILYDGCNKYVSFTLYNDVPPIKITSLTLAGRQQVYSGVAEVVLAVMPWPLLMGRDFALRTRVIEKIYVAMTMSFGVM
jgi:hypothetical protein